MGAPDSAAWRHETRTRLLAARSSLPHATRLRKDDRITASLLACFEPLALGVIGSYVPMHAEFDPRRALEALRAWGARIVRPGEPREVAPRRATWRRGFEPTRASIPGPLAACPDALLVPATGFDEHGYMLGYGDGCFDRTLARLDPHPLKICVTYELGRLETIRPQSHDVPMHFIVTERDVYEVTGEGLRAVARPLDAAAAASRILADARAFRHDGLVALLNELLEAERALSKAIAVFALELPFDTRVRDELLRLQGDESANCVVLLRLLRKRGDSGSRRTGAFFGKALAVNGTRARLELLNRGQAWMARRIAAALPGIGDAQAGRELALMLDSHMANMAACESILASLPRQEA
jgi:5,10-methenyltetrahydrofolate synthetase